MNKKEKKYLDPESKNNSSSANKLINNSFLSDSEEELKAIQRAIALLRQDLPKIVRNELIRSKRS